MMFRPHQDEVGQGLVEYALMIALIAVVLVAGITALGTALDSSISDSAQQMFD